MIHACYLKHLAAGLEGLGHSFHQCPHHCQRMNAAIARRSPARNHFSASRLRSGMDRFPQGLELVTLISHSHEQVRDTGVDSGQ